MLGYDINSEYIPKVKPKTSIKKICVPFNFSKCAYVGLKYATALAKLVGSELLILNCYQSTVLAYGSSEDVTQRLETYERKKEILKKIPELSKIYTSMLIEHAFLPEVLTDLCKNNKIDMVIMGTQLSGDRQKIFGTNASSLINHIDVPLLIIPDDIKKIKLRDVMLAVDYKESVNPDDINLLKSFARLFKATINIVHISNHGLESDQVSIENQLKGSFDGIDHKFYQSDHRKIHAGLQDFIEVQAMDMIAMTPRKHGIMESIYQPSETKKMALDTKIPLLVLHADKN